MFFRYSNKSKMRKNVSEERERERSNNNNKYEIIILNSFFFSFYYFQFASYTFFCCVRYELAIYGLSFVILYFFLGNNKTKK